MGTNIHATAVVSDKAQLGEGVQIGPFCVIGDNVSLGDNVRLESHVAIDGITTIGDHTHIFPFASLGHVPQDLKYHGEASSLEIGSHNIIREHVTMNPGTAGDKMVTRVGSHCLFMMASHVAHDCVVGDHVILANNATLAGHVEVGDYVVIGGLAAVHQFVRIGKHAMIGGMSGIEQDVIPFGVAMGKRAQLSGLNIVGMKRRDVSRDSIHGLRNVFKVLFQESGGTFEERLQQVKASPYAEIDEVKSMLRFITDDTSRAILQIS